jgi:hypothetical protein
METDKANGPVPNASDFHPTTPRARTSIAMDEPVTLRTPSPATHAPTKLLPPSPLIINSLCDLSTLCSDTPNPWGTLHCCHYSRSPCDFSALRLDSGPTAQTHGQAYAIIAHRSFINLSIVNPTHLYTPQSHLFIHPLYQNHSHQLTFSKQLHTHMELGCQNQSSECPLGTQPHISLSVQIAPS